MSKIHHKTAKARRSRSRTKSKSRSHKIFKNTKTITERQHLSNLLRSATQTIVRQPITRRKHHKHNHKQKHHKTISRV